MGEHMGSVHVQAFGHAASENGRHQRDRPVCARPRPRRTEGHSMVGNNSEITIARIRKVIDAAALRIRRVALRPALRIRAVTAAAAPVTPL